MAAEKDISIVLFLPGLPLMKFNGSEQIKCKDHKITIYNLSSSREEKED